MHHGTRSFIICATYSESIQNAFTKTRNIVYTYIVYKRKAAKIVSSGGPLLLIHATYEIRVSHRRLLHTLHSQMSTSITFYLHLPIIFTLLAVEAMLTINIPIGTDRYKESS